MIKALSMKHAFLDLYLFCLSKSIWDLNPFLLVGSTILFIEDIKGIRYFHPIFISVLVMLDVDVSLMLYKRQI